jgi:histidinol-phosphate aminotransferase
VFVTTRAALDTIPEYVPESGGCEVQLSDNTNRWGPAPSAARIIRDSALELHEYPSPDGRLLRDAAADYVGVSPSQIVTGCGSDGVLNAILGSVARPGDVLAYSEPTFGWIPALAHIRGLQPLGIAFAADHQIDVDAVLRANARLTYVCAPNNPTGAPVDRDIVRQLARKTEGLVLVDEAYAEFADSSVIDLVSQYPNLIVTRTLSKAFGLAGLRAGYAVACEPLARAVEKVRGPFTVNQLAERAGAAALRHDRDWMLEHVRAAVENRDRLASVFRAAGYAPLASAANFLCVPVRAAAPGAAQLRQRGIAVRSFSALRGIGDALRITSAPWAQLERFIDAMPAALPEPT